MRHETQTYRRHRHIEDTEMDTDDNQKMFQSDQFLGFSLAAATGNDPLAAGNIAATLVTDYN